MVDINNLRRLYAARRASAEDYAIWADAWMNAASVQLAKSQGSIAHDVAVESEMAHESLSALTSVIQAGIDRTLAERAELPPETIAELRRLCAYWNTQNLPANWAPSTVEFVNAAREWLPKLLDLAEEVNRAHELVSDLEPVAGPLSAGEPDGMETTAEERNVWNCELPTGLFPPGSKGVWANRPLARLVRDFDRQSAEIIRLGRELAEAKANVEGWIEQTKLANEAASAREAKAREEERARLLRDVQAMREQYAPLEQGEAVMLDTLQNHVEQRARSQP